MWCALASRCFSLLLIFLQVLPILRRSQGVSLVNSLRIISHLILGSDTFIKNPDGSLYIGQVWPGYSVFPDWFATKTLAWWTEALKNWTELGVELSGVWLDMNEPSSFCSNSW